ncbi:MAG: hypothetical protein US42_C0003G0030 [Candidatus Magasanikbacteria bacterium GW2011_GWC2_37_14]|uniref:Uncharacterized protein n=1 Tax=Candidatus Magasanikbacteria bacterium GW2011_GWC2_37_14 TaxID=1619046 RepID=A0A0G0GA27_9BACT|nr:MAG: hypothetical protein US42_C0003G0030 [Candidatus Magasanikbacteria bacterium GW2011_GWC2_37_14]
MKSVLPQKRLAPGTGAILADGNWRCRCLSKNVHHDLFGYCKLCRTTKPPPGKVKGGIGTALDHWRWQCSCTNKVHDWDITKCPICTYTRPKGRPEEVKQFGQWHTHYTWRCKCGKKHCQHNASVPSCQHCHCCRPDESSQPPEKIKQEEPRASSTSKNQWLDRYSWECAQGHVNSSSEPECWCHRGGSRPPLADRPDPQF